MNQVRVARGLAAPGCNSLQLEGDTMKLPRRRFLQLAGIVATLPTVPRTARAQTYPARPVRLIVGFPPGGTNDVLARLLGQWLTERLGQTFVVENRPGAASNVATEAVVRAPPDGYTLLLVGPAHAVNATLYDRLSYDFLRDIVPVASISREPLFMVVHPSVPATTVPQFIAHARANPGKINMASAGNGTAPHMSGELFKMMTGVDMLHVPYRGGAPAIADLLGGQVQVSFATPPAIAYIRAGRLRALAVTTAQRSQALPDVPALGDFVPGYESSGLYGIGAPANTPAAIIGRLNKEVNAALADPQMKARLTDLGGEVLAGSPAEFGALIAAETAKWARVVRFSGARPD